MGRLLCFLGYHKWDHYLDCSRPHCFEYKHVTLRDIRREAKRQGKW